MQTSLDQLGGGGVGLVHQSRISVNLWCSLVTDFLCGLLAVIGYAALFVGRLSYRGLARLEGLSDPGVNTGAARNDALPFHVDQSVSATLQCREAFTFSRNIIYAKPIQVHDAHDNLSRGAPLPEIALSPDVHF